MWNWIYCFIKTCMIKKKSLFHMNFWIVPGDPAIRNATQGRKICRFGVDASLAFVVPWKDDVDTLLPFAAFLHTKWIKTSFPSNIRLSLSSPNHCVCSWKNQKKNYIFDKFITKLKYDVNWLFMILQSKTLWFNIFNVLFLNMHNRLSSR